MPNSSSRSSGGGGGDRTPTPRFQEGSVDEVSFRAADIGPLSSIILAPEVGTWELEEVGVSCTDCQGRHKESRWGRGTVGPSAEKLKKLKMV